MPASRLRKVDLPFPEGPTRKSRSPFLKRKIVDGEAERVAAGPREPHARHPHYGGLAMSAAEAFGLASGCKLDHRVPVRLSAGLSRVTSKLAWPLGEIRETSRPCVLGNSLK